MTPEEKALSRSYEDWLEGHISYGEYTEIKAMYQQNRRCKHKRTDRSGGHHFGGGEYSDNIHEVCLDCGQKLG